MFGSKKKEQRKAQGRTKRSGNPKSLSQFGLMDVPSIDEIGADDPEDDNEAALEAELQQLMYGDSKTKKPVKKKMAPKPQVDLDSMVASCMQDIPSDEDELDDDDDDPSLLAELTGMQSDDDEDVEMHANVTNIQPAAQLIQPLNQPNNTSCDDTCAGQDLLSVIDSRISNYTSAERYAKEAGEMTRARRFARGLATLTDLRRNVNSGVAVDENEIPPAVVVKSASKTTSPVLTPEESVSPNPTKQENSPPKKEIETHKQVTSPQLESLTLLKQRRDECKSAALKAKNEGDKDRAIAGLIAVKECDALMASLKSGEISTIDKLPEIRLSKGEAQTQARAPDGATALVNRQFSRDDPVEMPDNPEDIPPPDPSIFGAPPPPKTVEEALQQRLIKYRGDEQKAKEEGNTSKARRLGRISKQYTDAIRLHKAGKPIPVDELPTPPGFGPIPSGKPQSLPTGAVGATVAFPHASTVTSTSTSPAAASVTASNPGVKPSPPAAAAGAGAVKPKGVMSLRDKQVLQLQKMQAQFKEAAVKAKKAGQMEQAKEYLKQMKGFDKVIEAAKCGLPVDFKTLPVPPQNVKGN